MNKMSLIHLINITSTNRNRFIHKEVSSNNHLYHNSSYLDIFRKVAEPCVDL